MIRRHALRRGTHISLRFCLRLDQAMQSCMTSAVGCLPSPHSGNDTSKSLSGCWWRRFRNDLKIRCFMALLINHVQRMRRLGVCSPLPNCKLCFSDDSCGPTSENGATQRKNRPLLVQHYHNLKSPTQRRGNVSVWTSSSKYWVLDTNTHIQQAGNTTYRQRMLTHACLDVMIDDICHWPVNKFTDLPAHRKVVKQYGTDKTTDLPVDRHVWTPSTVLCYCAFGQRFGTDFVLFVWWKYLSSLAYRTIWRIPRHELPK